MFYLPPKIEKKIFGKFCGIYYLCKKYTNEKLL